MHIQLLISLLVLLPIIAPRAEPHDDFHHLGEINKASIVMLAEENIVPAELAASIAKGIAEVIDEQDRGRQHSVE